MAIAIVAATKRAITEKALLMPWKMVMVINTASTKTNWMQKIWI